MEYRMMPYYDGFIWQWMVTLNSPAIRSEYEADKLSREWQGRVSQAEKIKIGSMVMFYDLPSPHMQVLMLGWGKDGRTLWDSDVERCKELWHGECVIRPLHSNKQIAEYLADEIPDGRRTLKMHNWPLLKAA